MSEVDGPVVPKERPRMSQEDYYVKMEERGLTPEGNALQPDPTPMQPPLGYKRQPSMVEHIRNMVRSEHLRLAAEQSGAETFEEADDFDIDDDLPEPSSAYEFEENFEPPVRQAPAPANEPAPSTSSVAPGATPSSAAPSAASPAPTSPPATP